MVSSFGQREMHRTGRLELHGLAPELGPDARLLPEDETLGLGVAGAHGRVVGHLQDYNTLELLTTIRYEHICLLSLHIIILNG